MPKGRCRVALIAPTVDSLGLPPLTSTHCLVLCTVLGHLIGLPVAVPQFGELQ